MLFDAQKPRYIKQTKNFKKCGKIKIMLEMLAEGLDMVSVNIIYYGGLNCLYIFKWANINMNILPIYIHSLRFTYLNSFVVVNIHQVIKEEMVYYSIKNICFFGSNVINIYFWSICLYIPVGVFLPEICLNPWHPCWAWLFMTQRNYLQWTAI